MSVYYQFNTCSALYHHLLSQSHINNNDKDQPGAGASFSVSGVNEPEILLSLWAFKLIQSGQISVRMKSVSARSPLRPLWRSCRTL